MKVVTWKCDVCGRGNGGMYVRPVVVTVAPPEETAGQRIGERTATLTRDLCEGCVTRLLNEFGVYQAGGELVPDDSRRYRNEPLVTEAAAVA